MITVMRQYMKALHIFLWLVVGSLVLTTFYVWGKGSLAGIGGAESGGVAVVNGETIPAERYRRLYQSYLNRYSQLYPDRFTPEMADRVGRGDRGVPEGQLPPVRAAGAPADPLRRGRRQGLAAGDHRRRGPEVLRRAPRRVRDAPPGAGRPRADPGARDGGQRGRGQGSGEGGRADPPGPGG